MGNAIGSGLGAGVTMTRRTVDAMSVSTDKKASAELPLCGSTAKSLTGPAAAEPWTEDP